MSLICFASPKGGVGKTMLTANIGAALHRLGWRVLAIDFDLQNALRSHFELPTDWQGIASTTDRERDWSELVVNTPSGMSVLPFGAASVTAAIAVTEYAAAHRGWITDHLAPFLEREDRVVVADMPPGPSPYLAELAPIADLALAVLLADAASLALLPRIRSGEFFLDPEGGRTDRIGYVFNQIDHRHLLGRNVLALSEQVLGDDLYGIVHRDEAVAEAVACRVTLLDYAPDSAASHDVIAIAQRIDRRLKAGMDGRSGG
jgi:cellulose synthase operon protein YhjQ